MPRPTPRGMAFLGLLLTAGMPATLICPAAALAQAPAAAAPAVGVTPVARRAITRSNEFIGRVEAADRVDLAARVTAFLDERAFTEGAEVRKGALLFRLERAPFEAALQVSRANVAEAQAQLENANITLNRAQALLNTVAGQRSNVDTALAAQRTASAQLLAAQAQQKQAQINLDYTEIRAPLDGRIGRASVTAGNVVTPNSGALATIVSQDPMYVTFTVPVRTMTELRGRYAGQGGIRAAVLRVRLPDGALYEHPGQVNFVDIDVGQDTDSILLRGTVPNPPQADGLRGLTAGMFVNVVVEAVQPVQALVIPRAAILSDQRGDFVYVIADGNKAERRGIRMGPQSSPETAVIEDGLKEGERVVAEGLQRVRPGVVVSPAPLAAQEPPPATVNSAGPAPAKG